MTADTVNSSASRRAWSVSELCRAVADALEARFNPVTVRGEVSGFSRATSGHCYFTLKDEQGQLRCAMFRRAASLVTRLPRDGELVELRGRIDLYGARGELQLIVESLSRAGAGVLFEEFLQLKAKLELEGLFGTARKRSVPALPCGIGLVTSLGAAALHDVVSALQRRAPHVPVLLVPAAVQGVSAAQDMIEALSKLYQHAYISSGLAADMPANAGLPTVEVIVLVRGGGALEDLWAFNDERLARCIAQSPVPVITGIGHETDFTIADFVADLRAPTPTAAAEMAAQPQADGLDWLSATRRRLDSALFRQVDRASLRMDGLAARLARPSVLVARERMRMAERARRLHHAVLAGLQRHESKQAQRHTAIPAAMARALAMRQDRLQRAELRLGLLDPTRTLQRGYAWLLDDAGGAVTLARSTRVGQRLRGVLVDGELDLRVTPPRLI